MKTPLILSTFLISFVIMLTTTMAAAPVGKVEKASGSASATGPSGKRKLSTGSNIYQGDTIKTGSSVNLHVRFSDQTKLVIGPRSTLKIAQFVRKGRSSASKFAIAAARGTFRFISGNSAKSAYKISTRSATIGIRGTGFDFVERGGVSVVLYNGSLVVCTKGNCRNLNNKCQMVRQTGSKLFKSTTDQLPPNAYRLTFPFIRYESRLLRDYRLGAGACDSGVGTEPTGGNNGNGGGKSNGSGNGGNDGGSTGKS